MQRLPSIITGTAVVGTALVLLLGGFLSTAPAASPVNFMNSAFGDVLFCSDVRLAQHDQFGNFDRDSCELSCKSRFGVGPIPYVEEQAWGDYGGYYAYSYCIDACNRQFWHDFDRKMENLKDMP